MSSRRTVMMGMAATALVSCGPTIKTYDGPEVTRIVVQKAQRRMYLVNEAPTETSVLRVFKIDLGNAPAGDKKVSGDGKTPEGAYFIDRKNPRSAFHLSLGISYPNDKDRAEAEALGQSPGGDIFIHGARKLNDRRGPDWTAGCISVSNEEVEDIYAMVAVGTRIDINP